MHVGGQEININQVLALSVYPAWVVRGSLLG